MIEDGITTSEMHGDLQNNVFARTLGSYIYHLGKRIVLKGIIIIFIISRYIPPMQPNPRVFFRLEVYIPNQTPSQPRCMEIEVQYIQQAPCHAADPLYILFKDLL